MPYIGDYRIEAIGAAGGYDTSSSRGQYQGRAARMKGTFRLFKGEKIQILVGQEGGINTRSQSAGGGGGTFVVRGSNTPLIIAGGGGGIETASSRHSGCDASTGTAGNVGYKSWSGGSGGQGATTADNDNSGEMSVSRRVEPPQQQSSLNLKSNYIRLLQYGCNLVDRGQSPQLRMLTIYSYQLKRSSKYYVT